MRYGFSAELDRKWGSTLTVVFSPGLYIGLAICVLVFHALFVLWVAVGAFLTKSRPVLRWLHVGSLSWGILIEVLPSPCSLTMLENSLERQAGVQPYQGGFLLHFLDSVVYADISATLLASAGVVVCSVNLMVCVWRICAGHSSS